MCPPFVFASGCIGYDRNAKKLVEGGIQAQARQALQNLQKIVEASGSELGKVVKTTVRAERRPPTTAYVLTAMARSS